MTKILLVEDNEMNRDMLSRRLKRRGYDVILAIDGALAVSLAQSEQPDLILMDMSLPVLDGWDATRQIKAQPNMASIPIIALTAHAMVGDREKALQAGCDDYDTKPVELKRLLKKIQDLLEAMPRNATPAVSQDSSSSMSSDVNAAIPAANTSTAHRSTLSTTEISATDTSATDTSATDTSATDAVPLNDLTGQIVATKDSTSILVVDDNEMNRDVLGRRLRKAGYDVHFAESGEDALEQLQRTSITLVLLDVMMPGIGGWETLRQIRLESSATTLPVIMVTAKDQSEDVVKAFGLGANDYITKPVDFPIALARIQSQLQLVQASLSENPVQLNSQNLQRQGQNNDGQRHSRDHHPEAADGQLSGQKEQKNSSNGIQEQDALSNDEQSLLLQIIEPESEVQDSQANSSTLLNNRYDIFGHAHKSKYHQTFLAYDTHHPSKQVVSIQRFSLDNGQSKKLIQSWFRQDLNSLSTVFSHSPPQIVRLLEAYVIGDYYYLIQEHIDGSLMSSELVLGRSHTLLYAMNLVGRLLEILSVFHQENVALQNFSIDSFTRRKRDGEIILTDLGISRRLNRLYKLEQAALLNNAIYTSNAQSIDLAESNSLSEDLYYIGLIVIQALTGIRPTQHYGTDADKRFEWQEWVDVNPECATYINRLIQPDKTKCFSNALDARRKLLHSQLLLHAVKQNVAQKGGLL